MTLTTLVATPTPTTAPPDGGVSEVTRNSNKRSNAGMDVTDFPDDLVL
ncbi:hypothetical protein [Streptomyces sp. NPDC020597]